MVICKRTQRKCMQRETRVEDWEIYRQISHKRRNRLIDAVKTDDNENIEVKKESKIERKREREREREREGERGRKKVKRERERERVE